LLRKTGDIRVAIGRTPARTAVFSCKRAGPPAHHSSKRHVEYRLRNDEIRAAETAFAIRMTCSSMGSAYGEAVVPRQKGLPRIVSLPGRCIFGKSAMIFIWIESISNTFLALRQDRGSVRSGGAEQLRMPIACAQGSRSQRETVPVAGGHVKDRLAPSAAI
jgi:hypothetical protein